MKTPKTNNPIVSKYTLHSRKATFNEWTTYIGIFNIKTKIFIKVVSDTSYKHYSIGISKDR